jgi:hypothetical protein
VRCASQLAVGAYVLDALEPDEQLRMEEHLQRCPVCAETVRELQGLPRVLAGVPTPGEAPVAPPPSELAFERFRLSAAAAPPAQARRPVHWRLVAAAAAVLAVGGGVAAGVAATSRDAPVTVVEAEAGNVHARASLTAAGTGTKVALALDGVPFGANCQLIAVARDGSEDSAGTWAVSYGGTYHWTGWVSVAPGQLDRLVIRAGDGRTLVSVPG